MDSTDVHQPEISNAGGTGYQKPNVNFQSPNRITENSKQPNLSIIAFDKIPPTNSEPEFPAVKKSGGVNLIYYSGIILFIISVVILVLYYIVVISRHG